VRAIDAAEIAVFVGPLVPDTHTVLVQIFDVRVAAQEPEQFVDDRFEVEFFGREQRKTVGERKARLRAKDRAGTRAGPVGFEFSFLQHEPEQFVILKHSQRLPTRLV